MQVVIFPSSLMIGRGDFEQYRLFTQANVIQDRDGDAAAPTFVYEGTGKKARTTAVQAVTRRIQS